MLNKMNIRKGDNVVVITGRYKGTKGRVLKAFPKDQKVIVENVNFVKRHTRRSQKNQTGGIIEKEAPIHVSNVMLFNSKINAVTKAIIKVVDGNRIRICKKTGDQL